MRINRIKTCVAIVPALVLVACQGSQDSGKTQDGAASLSDQTQNTVELQNQDVLLDGSWVLNSVGSKDSGEYLSSEVSLSADGRFLTFQSSADNLVPNDTNRTTDIFVLDLIDGSVRLISSGENGTPSNGASTQPRISHNGEFIAYRSVANNLVDIDNNRTADIFVHEMSTGKNLLASLSNSGLQIDIESRNPSISADGQRVAFETRGSTVVVGDNNAAVDVFVRDLSESRTYAITSNYSVGESSVDRINQDSGDAQISNDGMLVVFQSFSPFLVAADNNGYADIFVAEIETGMLSRISETDFVGGNADSLSPSISGNGRFISFSSAASNFAESNTNEEMQIYVHDYVSKNTKMLSVAADGSPGDGPSLISKVADNGDSVFVSYSTNLDQSEQAISPNIFVSRYSGDVRRVENIVSSENKLLVESGLNSFEIDLLAREVVFIGSRQGSQSGPSIYRFSYEN